MKLASVTVSDRLAAQVGRVWPDASWSQVVEYAVGLAVDAALVDAPEDALVLDDVNLVPGTPAVPDGTARINRYSPDRRNPEYVAWRKAEGMAP